MPVTIDELVYRVGADASELEAGARKIKDTIADVARRGEQDFERMASRTRAIFKDMSHFAAGALDVLGFPVSMMSSWEAAGQAVGRATRAIVGFAQESAAVDTVRDKFDALARSAGQNADAILNAMRRATDGAVDDFTLMTQANAAFMAQLDITPERMTQLMEIARSASQATGESLTFMVQSLIQAFAKQEKEILDNLNIIVTADAAYERHAASVGKLAKDLTDAEKRQAFFNEGIRIGTDNLQRAGGVQASATDNFAQMGVAITNAQMALGRLFSPSVVGIMNAFAGGMTSLADGLSQLAPLFESASSKSQRLQSTLAGLKAETDAQIESISSLQGEYNRLHSELDSQNLTTSDSERIHGELKGIIDKLIAAVPALGSVFREYGDDVNTVNATLERQKAIQMDLLRFAQRDTAQAMRESLAKTQEDIARERTNIMRLEDEARRTLETTQAEWMRMFREATLLPDEAGIRMLRALGDSFEEFQRKGLAIQKTVDDGKESIKGLEAQAELAKRQIRSFIEELKLTDALTDIEAYNQKQREGVALTAEQTDKNRQQRAELRALFGVAGEEAEAFLNTLLEINRTPIGTGKGEGEGSGDTKPKTLSEAEIKTLSEKLKKEITDVELAQRQAAVAAGEAFTANYAAQLVKAQEFLAKEANLTEAAVMTNIATYREFADTIIGLRENILKEQQKSIEAGLKSELDAIDAQRETRELSTAEAINRLDTLLAQHAKNADAEKFLTAKIEQFKRVQIKETADQEKRIAESQEAQRREAADQERARIQEAFANLARVREAVAAGVAIDPESALGRWVRGNEVALGALTEMTNRAEAEMLSVFLNAQERKAKELKKGINATVISEEDRVALIRQIDEQLLRTRIERQRALTEVAKKEAKTQSDLVKVSVDESLAHWEILVQAVEAGLPGAEIPDAPFQEWATREMERVTRLTDAKRIGGKEEARIRDEVTRSYLDNLQREVEASKLNADEQKAIIDDIARRRTRSALAAALTIQKEDEATAEAQKKIRQELNAFLDAADEAQTATAVNSIRERLARYVNANADMIESSDELRRVLAEINGLLKAQADAILDLDKAHNKLALEMRTPWGIILNLDQLRNNLTQAERQFGKFSDEWRRSLQELEGAYQDLFSMIHEGLNTLGIELDDMGNAFLDFAESMMMGNPWGAAIAGANMLKDILQDIRLLAPDIADVIVVDFAELAGSLARVQREIAETERLLKAIEGDRLLAAEVGIPPATLKAKLKQLRDFEAQLISSLTKKTSEDMAIEARQAFGESFASGFSGDISNIIQQSITQIGPDAINFGEMLGDNFSRAFLMATTRAILEQSQLQPLLEKFGRSVQFLLEDGVLDPLEAAALQKQRDTILAVAEDARRQVDDVMRALDIEFEQKADASRARREQESRDIEAFQTISNITRFQANQIVAQLTQHSNYLNQIAINTAQILSVGGEIAANTRTRANPTIINNNMDEQAAVDAEVRAVQGQGIAA